MCGHSKMGEEGNHTGCGRGFLGSLENVYWIHFQGNPRMVNRTCFMNSWKGICSRYCSSYFFMPNTSLLINLITCDFYNIFVVTVDLCTDNFMLISTLTCRLNLIPTLIPTRNRWWSIYKYI